MFTRLLLWACLFLSSGLVVEADEANFTHAVANSGLGVPLLKSPGSAGIDSGQKLSLADDTKVVVLETRRDSAAPTRVEWCLIEAVVNGGKVRGWVSRGALRPLRFDGAEIRQRDSKRRMDWSWRRFGIAENPLGTLLMVRRPDSQSIHHRGNQIGPLGKGTLVELGEQVKDPRTTLQWKKVRVLSGKMAGKEGWVAAELAKRVHEVRFRTFIPSPVVALGVEKAVDPVKELMIFKGDGRSFAYNHGTERSFQNAVVSFERAGQTQFVGGVLIGQQARSPQVVDPERDFGETIGWKVEDGIPVFGRPLWWWQLKSQEPTILGRERLRVSQVNNRVRIDWRDQQTIRVRFILNGSNPLMKAAPAINADLTVLLRRSGQDDVMVSVEGRHDGFPAYELYIDGHPVYWHDPVERRQHPLSLAHPAEWAVQIPWTRVKTRSQQLRRRRYAENRQYDTK